jgi:hypothetical protein
MLWFRVMLVVVAGCVLLSFDSLLCDMMLAWTTILMTIATVERMARRARAVRRLGWLGARFRLF